MRTIHNGNLLNQDAEFYKRELSAFIPDRIFDAHAHLNHPSFLKNKVPGLPDAIGCDEYLSYMSWLFPDRDLSALFLSYTDKADKVSASNEWTSVNAARDGTFRGLFFIKPDDDPEWVRSEVRRLGLHGLKCYHSYAPVTPTWEADIPQYLPEGLVRIADDEHWIITLHMVKARSVADPSNIHWIRTYCEKYPNMRLILAHSARGFQPNHNLEGLPQLIGLNNLYFDSSANCESNAHAAIIRIVGHDKLMYGSDGLIVSHLRGRSVAVADSFLWLYEDTPVWGDAKHKKIKPILIGLEHLGSLKWACWAEKLSDRQVEDIFWNNAAKLFDIN